MRYVAPSTIDGRIAAPPSKSAMVRAVAAGTLARGRTVIRNPADCADGRAAMAVARSLGAVVELEGAELSIEGISHPSATTEPGPIGEPTELDCGESGLCMRLFAPIAALDRRPTRLLARGSLRSRPMGMVQTALRELGAQCSAAGGRAPLEIRGPIDGAELEVDGSTSSQLLSGLLFALPLCAQDSVLRVPALRSHGYVAMTIELLRRFGVELVHDDDLSRFAIPGRQQLRAETLQLEADWSGAAFVLVAGAIAGSVELTGLALGSCQPDRTVVQALERAGATIELDEQAGAITVRRSTLRGFEVDLTDCPDLFPPLAALACHCAGRTELIGAERLQHKESDRAAALLGELGKMGASITLEGNRLCVTGGSLGPAQVDARGDHRIAMACAVAALGAAGEVRIQGAECVDKSYAAFFEDLASLGARVS